ncbi:MAG: hypothetical protein LUE17_12000 [Planctomycetaceae bacterium]|nr:hypothetical protein [Planctomycetaceae bacterium]
MIICCPDLLAAATVSMEVWITKDAAGSCLWTERPRFDADLERYYHDTAETVAVPSAFTAAWPAKHMARLVVRQPGQLL